MSRFRIPNLINIKQNRDFMGPRCLQMFFFLNTGKANCVYVNVTVLAV